MNNLGEWDLQKLSFLPSPLLGSIHQVHPRLGIKDKLIWSKTKKGNFSVKSANRVARDFHNRDCGMSSNFPLNNFNKLWNLTYPPDLILFIWKMIKNLLPTTQNLKNHHMKIDKNCTFCLSHPETIKHLFLVIVRQLDFGLHRL